MLFRVATHCYGTLSYCIFLPDALNKMLAVLSVFAINFAADTRLPCWFEGFDYFTELKIVALAPIILMAGGAVVGVSMEAWKRRNDGARERHDDGVVVAGLWLAAPVLLQVIDLIYPVCARTLLQFNTCRDLGAAGWWLEVDYRIRCFDADGKADPDYEATRAWVVIVGVLYAVGCPAAFFYLAHRYRHDASRHHELGWMLHPFRRDKVRFNFNF